MALVDKPENIPACGMCNNAFVDPELRPDNDLSYFTLGDSVDGKRMMLRSGAGKPVEIIMEEFDRKSMRWGVVGCYIPKFCPNCGRKLVENERSLANDRRRT